MPPAKVTAIDTRNDAQSVRERQIAAAAHARASKKNIGQQQALQNGGLGTLSLREIMRIGGNGGGETSSGDAAAQQGQGVRRTIYPTSPTTFLRPSC